jgi:hypothetical protein
MTTQVVIDNSKTAVHASHKEVLEAVEMSGLNVEVSKWVRVYECVSV